MATMLPELLAALRRQQAELQEAENLAVSRGEAAAALSTAATNSLVLTLHDSILATCTRQQWRAAGDVILLSRLVLGALQHMQQSRLEFPRLPPRFAGLPLGLMKRAAHGLVSALQQSTRDHLQVHPQHLPLLALPPALLTAASQQEAVRLLRQPPILAAAVPSLQQTLLALDTTPPVSAAHAVSGVFNSSFGSSFSTPLDPFPLKPPRYGAAPPSLASQGSRAGSGSTPSPPSACSPAEVWDATRAAVARAAAVARRRDASSILAEQLVVTVSIPLRVAAAGDEPLELWCALYDAATGRAITQEWHLPVDRTGLVCVPEHSQTVAPGVFVANDVKQTARQMNLFSGGGDPPSGGEGGGIHSLTMSFSGINVSFILAGRAYLGCRAFRLGRLRPRSGLMRNLMSNVHDTARRAAGVTSPNSVTSPSSGGRPRSGSDDAAAGQSRWKKLFSRGFGDKPSSPDTGSRRGSDASVTTALLGSASSSPAGSGRELSALAAPGEGESWSDLVPLPQGHSVLEPAYRRPLGYAVCFLPPSAVPLRCLGRGWRSKLQEKGVQGPSVPGGAVAGAESDGEDDSDDGGEGGGESSGGGGKALPVGLVHTTQLQWMAPAKGDEAVFASLIPQLIAADVAAAHAVVPRSGEGGGAASGVPPAPGTDGQSPSSESAGPVRVGRLYTGRARAPSDRSTSSPFAGVSGGGQGGVDAPAGAPHGLTPLLKGKKGDLNTWGGEFSTHRYAFRPGGSKAPPPQGLPWCDVRPGAMHSVSSAAAQSAPIEKAPRMLRASCSAVVYSAQGIMQQLARSPASDEEAPLDRDSDSDEAFLARARSDRASVWTVSPPSESGGGLPLPPLASMAEWLLPWLRPESLAQIGPMAGGMRTGLHWQLLNAAPLHGQLAAVALAAPSDGHRGSGHWPAGRQSGKRQAKRSSLYRALEEATASRKGSSMDADGTGSGRSFGPGAAGEGAGTARMATVYGGGDLQGAGGGLIPADAGEYAPFEDITGVNGWMLSVGAFLLQETHAREYALNILTALEVLQGGLQGGSGSAATTSSSRDPSYSRQAKALHRELTQLKSSMQQPEGGAGGASSHFVDLAARCIAHMQAAQVDGKAQADATSGHWELLALHPKSRAPAISVLTGLAAAGGLQCLLSLSPGVLSSGALRTYGGSQSRVLAQRGVVADLSQVLCLLLPPSVTPGVLSTFQTSSVEDSPPQRGRGVSVVGRRHSVAHDRGHKSDDAVDRIAAAAAAAMLHGDSTSEEGGDAETAAPPLDPAWPAQQVSYVQITLDSGVFQQGKKKAGLNMQVRLHAVRRDGTILPCLARGVGWGGVAVPGDLGQAAARDYVGPLADEDGVPLPLTCSFTDGSGVVKLAVESEPDAAPVRRRSMSAAALNQAFESGESVPNSGRSSARNSGVGDRLLASQQPAMSGPRHRAAATPRAEADAPHHHVFAEHRKLFPEYRSAVYYHCNTPSWDETVTVVVPTVDIFDDLHIRLAYYHVSANDGRSFPVGFSFFPLSHPRTHVSVKPGVHKLPVYDAVQFMSTSQRQVAQSAAPYRRASALKISAGSPLHSSATRTPYLASFTSTASAASMFERGPAAARMTVYKPTPSRSSVRDRSLLLAKPGESVTVGIMVQSAVRTHNAPLFCLMGWRAALDSAASRQRLNSALLALMDSSPEQMVAHFAQIMSHLCALMQYLFSHSEPVERGADTAARADCHEGLPPTSEDPGADEDEAEVKEGEVVSTAAVLQQSGLPRSALALFAFALLTLQEAAAPAPATSNVTVDDTGVAPSTKSECVNRFALHSLSRLMSELRDGITPQAVLEEGGRVHTGQEDEQQAQPHTQGVQSTNTAALRVAAACTLEHFLNNFFSAEGFHHVCREWVSSSIACAPGADSKDPIVRSTGLMLLSALPSVLRVLVHCALSSSSRASNATELPSSTAAGPAPLALALQQIREAVLQAVEPVCVASVADASLPVQRLAWHAVVQTAALQGAVSSLDTLQHVTSNAVLRDWISDLLLHVQPLAHMPVLASVAGSMDPPIEALGGSSQGAGLPASQSIRWQAVPAAYKLRGWVPGSKALAVAKLSALQAVLSHPAVSPSCDCPSSQDPSHAKLWQVACVTAHHHLTAEAQAERMLAAAVTSRLAACLHAACLQHSQHPPESDTKRFTAPLLPRTGLAAAPLSSAAWKLFTLLPELSSAIVLCEANDKNERHETGSGNDGVHVHEAAQHKPPPFARILHPHGPTNALNLDVCPSGPMQAAGIAGDIISNAVLFPVTSTVGKTHDSVPVSGKRRALFGGEASRAHRHSAVSTRNSVPLEQSLAMLQMLLSRVGVIHLKMGALQNAVGARTELAVEPLLAVDAHVWLLPQLMEQPFIHATFQSRAASSGSQAGEDTLSGLQSFAAGSGDGNTRGVSFTEDVMSVSIAEPDTAGNRRSWSTYTSRSAGGASGGTRTRQGTTLQPPTEYSSTQEQEEEEAHSQQKPAPAAAVAAAAAALGAQDTLCSTYRFLVDSLLTLAEVVPEAGFARLCQSLSTPDGGFVGPGAAGGGGRTGPAGASFVGSAHSSQLSGILDVFTRSILAEGGRIALLTRVCTAVNTVLASPAYPATWQHHHARCAAAFARLLQWSSFAAASLYLHDTVEAPSAGRALVRDVACGLLLKPLISAHVSLLTSRYSFCDEQWGAAPSNFTQLLHQAGVSSVPEAVMSSFAVLWGPHTVPAQKAYVAPAACTPTATGALQLAQSSASGSFLPARTRLMCAPIIIPVALEMTHARHTRVAQWARDLFLDVLKAEVHSVSSEGTAPKKSPKRAHRRSFAVLAREPQDEVQTTLPIAERWTIDTIDAIVARGGVILLPKWATSASQQASGDDASGTRSRNVYQPSESNMLMRLFSAGSSGQATDTAVIARQHRELLARPEVQKFLVECRTLFRMLSAVNSYPASPPELFEEERTEAALTLIQYLRNTHRADLFTTYVKYLTELHANMGNHAEAAYTQLLLLDLLSAQPVSQNAGTAADASTIEILQGVLSALTQGSKDWEQALLISRILAGRYFRLGSREAYLALQQVLTTTATIVHDLAKESTGRSKARARAPHYAVQYIGKGFPDHLRGRTFVYRQHANKAVAVFERGLREKWSRIVAEAERSMAAAGKLPEGCPRTPALLIKVPFDPLLQAVHVDGTRASAIDPDASGEVVTTTQETVDLDALPAHRDLRIAIMTVEPAPLAQQEAVEAAAVYMQQQVQDDTLQLQMYADALASGEELPLSPSGRAGSTAGAGDLEAWDPTRERCELRRLALLDSTGSIQEATEAYSTFQASARTVQVQSSLETSILVPAAVPRVDWRGMQLPPQLPRAAAPIVTPRAILIPPPPAESYAHPRSLVVLSRTRELKAGAFTLQALSSDALVRDMDVDAVVASIMCQDTLPPPTEGAEGLFGRSHRGSSASNPAPTPSHRLSVDSRSSDAPRGLTRRGSTNKRNPRRPSLLKVPEAAHPQLDADVHSSDAPSTPSLTDALTAEHKADLKDAMREQGSEGILPEKYSLIPPQLVPSVAPPSMDFMPVPPPNFGISASPGAGGVGSGLVQVWDDNWSALYAAVRHESIKQQTRYDAMPRPLRQGREQSRVRVFSAQRPVKTRKTENESLDVWVRCVWLVTNSAFPNLHRRSQVTHLHQILLTPFDSAIMLLRNKSDDVRFCISRAQHAPAKSDVNFLTGQLKGVLDAAVQGGIANYEVLLTGKYVETHPEIRTELQHRYGAAMAQWRAAQAQTANANTNGDSDSSATMSGGDSTDSDGDDDGGTSDGAADGDGQWAADAPALAALRHALADQMAVCGDGLLLHASKCKANMLPLHDYLCEKFAGLCDKLETLGVPVQQARDLGLHAREVSQQLQVLGTQAAAASS